MTCGMSVVVNDPVLYPDQSVVYTDLHNMWQKYNLRAAMNIEYGQYTQNISVNC